MKRRPNVLIVEDEPDQATLIVAQLERTRRFQTASAPSAERALEMVVADPPDIVVCDLVMPGIDGVAFTHRLGGIAPSIPVLILTGKGAEEDAERAFAAGARDFLTKPTEPSSLLVRIQRCLDEAPSRQILSQVVQQRFDPHGIVGSHPRTEAVRGFVDAVASVPGASALLLGESGTGKNLVARAIHGAGEGSNRPFVEVNCAAFPANLLESELFGHERGAFTGADRAKKGLAEEADGGTLFLDEIGAMPPELQAKLLSFLESRTLRRVGSTREIRVGVRIVAATNADLERDVAAGRFREDLYYRLNVASHVLPPLRAVLSDLPELARHFAVRAAEYFRKPVPRLDSAAVGRLQAHDWPGNARELRNVIERAMIFSPGPVLVIGDLGAPGHAPAGSADGLSVPLGLTLEEVERRYIQATLDAADGVVQDAAESLGVSRKVLWSRRRKHGLLPGDDDTRTGIPSE